MSRNWRTIAIVTVLAVSLLWGLREYSYRRMMEVHAENQYQRAFQDLSFHLDSLETEIGKAVVAMSPRQRMKSFSDVWRHTYSAQTDLGQLPVGALPLSRTETFLARLGSFTYAMAQRSAEGTPLSASDLNTLKELHRQAGFVSTSITKLRDDLDRKGIGWNHIARSLNVKTAVRPDTKPSDPVDPASKGLKMVEDGMKRFPDPDYGDTLPPEKVTPRALTGSEITADDAVRIARGFLGAERVSGMTVRVVSTVNTQPPTYRVEVRPRGKLPYRIITLDISRKGGHVLWMLDDRLAGISKLTMDEATAIGLRFLEERGYRNMKAIFREKTDNIALVTYAYVQDGVIIYPDQIKLRIALDNGAVLGVEATGYLTFHHSRVLPVARISPGEISTRFGPGIRVVAVRTVVIMDELGKEKLCYEFRTKLDDETYLTYVDALTAQEHKVQRLTGRGTEVI